MYQSTQFEKKYSFVENILNFKFKNNYCDKTLKMSLPVFLFIAVL